MAQNGAASGSLPNTDPTCSTSAQVSNPNNIQRSMFPSTSGMYQPASESQRTAVANSGTVRAQMINPSSGALHHQRMNGPNFIPNGRPNFIPNGLIRAPGMDTPVGLMQQHRMNSVVRASEPNMLTEVPMHPNMMNDTVCAPGMNMPPGSIQHMMNGLIWGSRTSIPTRLMQDEDIKHYNPPSEAMSFPFPQSIAMDIDGMYGSDFTARMTNDLPNGDFYARMMNSPPNGDFSEIMMNGPAPNNFNSSSLNNSNASQGEAQKGPCFSYQNPRQDDQ